MKLPLRYDKKFENFDRSIWGKTDTKNKSGQTHPLLAHLIDTGYVVKFILEKIYTSLELSILAEKVNLSVDEVVSFVSFAAACHDFGKLSSFQRLDLEKRPDHALLSMGVLAGLKENKFSFEILALLGGHHGDFKREKIRDCIRNIRKDKKVYKYNYDEESEFYYQILKDIFLIDEDIFNKVNIHDDILYEVNALIIIADWIASGPLLEKFGFMSTNMSLETYLSTLESHCEQIIPKILHYVKIMDNMDFQDLFEFKPNEMQQTIIDYVDNEQINLSEPSLCFIETRTSGGKTEAALWLSYCLAINLGHKGMHFTLPTQGTTNAMFNRMAKFSNKITNGQANLQLAHGGADLNEGFANYIKSISENEDLKDAVDWAMSKKKKLLAQFGDSTIDQLLMGVIRVKHFTLRLFGLKNKVVIIDEYHSYDAFMIHNFKQLLVEMKKAHCSVIVLSATLYKEMLNELASAWIGDEVKDVGYAAFPRITVINKTITSLPLPADKKVTTLQHFNIGMPLNSSWANDVKNNCTPLKDYKDAANTIVNEIAEGGNIAVYHNIVSKAQELYKEIKSIDENCILIHSRFRQEDFENIINKIIKMYGYGKGGANPHRPYKSTTVGTQAFQESLNVDFDKVYSFNSPADSLLQRDGRGHRFKEIVRAANFANPTLAIIHEFPESKKFCLDQYVYYRYICERTFHTLINKREIIIPEETDEIINSVYGVLDDSFACEEWQLAKSGKEQKAHEFRISSTPSDELIPKGVEIMNDDIDLCGIDDSLETPKEFAKTRDIKHAMKIILVFCKNGKKYLDPRFINELILKKEYSKEELLQIQQSSCPINNQQLFYYFSKNENKFEEWGKISALKYYGVLEFNADAEALIYGGYFSAQFKYSTDLGLETTINFSSSK